MARSLPPSASIAHAEEGARLVAPSAARNAVPLTELLLKHAPCEGNALEIASGTGQHVSAFATALPNLHWQPTEVDKARRASIDAHVSDAGLSNVSPAIALDATAPGWGATHHPKDLVLLANLLHLISEPEARTLITEATKALGETGILVLYGPFKRGGKLTSDGDVRFDSELRGADPNIGYKDDLDILRWLGDAGISIVETVEMPANNLAFVTGHPSP